MRFVSTLKLIFLVNNYNNNLFMKIIAKWCYINKFIPNVHLTLRKYFIFLQCMTSHQTIFIRKSTKRNEKFIKWMNKMFFMRMKVYFFRVWWNSFVLYDSFMTFNFQLLLEMHQNKILLEIYILIIGMLAYFQFSSWRNFLPEIP
jgi:hypothetical protein